MTSSPSENLTDRLEGSVQRLQHTIGSFQVRGVHLIPDLVVLGLARDIYENARASLLLSRSDVPRAGNACGRSALEGILDLLFLFTRPPHTYDHWGARARAAEVLDRERASELARRVDPQDEMDDANVDAEAVIETEAEVWDSHAGGKGAILRNALTEVRRARRKRRWHWTGYRRSELPGRIHDAAVDPHSFVDVIASWYSLLSIEAHPAPRLFADQLEFTAQGTVAVKVTAESQDAHERLTTVGVGAAFVAAESAREVLPRFGEEERERSE